jgi:hypothetical protein
MKKPILPTEIVLRFHPSKFLWGWWLLFSMAVLLSLWVSLPLLWAITGTVSYVAACLWQWTQLVATRWRWSIQTLKTDVFGQMFVVNTLGQQSPIKVLSDSVVHHHCIVLHISYLESMAGEGMPCQNHIIGWMQPTWLLILPDHTDRNSHRELRVWLTWGEQFDPQ